jgi:hypothetical protein
MLLGQGAIVCNLMHGICGQTQTKGIVMPPDYSSSDFADSAYDMRAQAMRARLYACLWLAPHDEASGRLLAFADELETRADAAECAPIAPSLMLA